MSRSNSLAVLLAAQAFGLDLVQAAELVGELRSSGRAAAGASICKAEDGPFTLLDESYNANPASTGCGSGARRQPAGARRIAVLGDMLELGPHGPELHAALARDVANNNIDLVFAAGPLMKQSFRRPAG